MEVADVLLQSAAVLYILRSMTDLPSPEFFDLQQAVAGRYSLEREIGRGGMGIVFLARDVALDRLVAIKLLPPTLAAVPTMREQFIREARTSAKLSHPHIVPIYAVEEIGDLVFFVMALVDGQTLTQRIMSKGGLSLQEAVRILREVAWALVHAHAQGVVHRDVKPDNILLEEGSGRALVTDFGIAQVMGSAVDQGSSDVIGTPEFMSPEQALGESVDARSDIYSLGIVAFLSLSGQLPFDAPTPAELVTKQIQTPAPKLTSVAPGTPRKLSRVVELCLRKEPDERIQTCEALGEALSAALETRGQLPVAVRLFVQQTKVRSERRLVYPMIGLWLGAPVLVTATAALGATVGLGILGFFLTLPIFNTGRRVRRVLAAGYDQNDVVRGFKEDLASRDEELRFLYGNDYRTDGKRLKKIALGAFGLTGVCLATAFATMSTPFVLPAVGLGLVGAITGMQADRRSDRSTKRRIKFWGGRIGRWFFELSGFGLKVKALPASLTYRPTEMAIGIAVSNLFAALPAETRAAMPDLPDVVSGLELDAQRMRQKIDEFNEVLENAGDETSGKVDDRDDLTRQRQRAIHNITVVRDEAQNRLSETVAALENLRVDLMRLRTGVVRLDSVTTNLGAARDLAAHVDRLLQGYEEIDKDLDGDRSSE